MHLDLDFTDSGTQIAETDIRMVGQERHWHGRIGKHFGDHEGREPDPEGVVVVAGVPDRNNIRLPGLLRANGDGIGRDQIDIAPAARPGVLHNRYGVQLDDARSEGAIFFGTGRRVGVLSLAG